MNNKIYAFYDIQARSIIGTLLLHRHDASAIRYFGDVLTQKDTLPGQHPEDFNLVCLGEILEPFESNLGDISGFPALADQKRMSELTLIPKHPAETILTGKQWLALQEKDTTQENG